MGRTSLYFLLVAVLSTPFLYYQLASSSDTEKRYTTECLECHEYHEEELLGTPHQINMDGGGTSVACSDCHVNVAEHLEDEDKAPDNLMTASVETSVEACIRCHASTHVENMMERDVHANNDLNCSTCHTVHENHNNKLLKEKTQTKLCLDCHQPVASDFFRSFRHPVADDVMKCTDCHATIAPDRHQFRYTGINDACYECHDQFQPPFPYEHQATIDFSTQEGGCLNCHAAHGSDNERMLNQPYEAPHFQTCSQCHVVPKHNNNQFHGTQWQGIPCSDCHVDIHGSYTNRLYLSPDLEAQGCFNAGCHRL